jgi:hypothetical protein
MTGNNGNGHARITCMSCTYLTLSTSNVLINIPANKVANGETIDNVYSDVTVTTNWSLGYTLKVEMVGSEGRLVRKDSVNGDTYINPTGDNQGTLDLNSWGVRWGSGNWRQVPVSGSSTDLVIADTSSAAVNGVSYRVYYGVRVDYGTVAGDYGGGVVYSVVGK